MFEEGTTAFSTIPSNPVTLGKVTALLYGSAIVVGSSNNSIKNTITGAHNPESDPTEFRLVKTLSNGIAVTGLYIKYNLSFRGLPVTSGEEVIWSGLYGGASYSSRTPNSGDLVASGFDDAKGKAEGTYKDTITVSVTTVN